ncbi:MAG: hypothetical protein CM15mP79_1720 [Methanobacteriota archaeon]|nr:MAG: hypothetical protein CM15mP79_1720 [Euryarchaeota archaeon]
MRFEGELRMRHLLQVVWKTSASTLGVTTWSTPLISPWPGYYGVLMLQEYAAGDDDLQ